MNDNDSKLASVSQMIDEVLRLKKINEELMDTLGSTVQWVLHYTAKTIFRCPIQRAWNIS